MRIILGIVVGALIVAYYPTAGDRVREITNTAASEVESATRDRSELEILLEDTEQALKEFSE